MNTITDQLSKLPVADRWRLLIWLAARHPGAVAQGLAHLARAGAHQDVPAAWRIREPGALQRASAVPGVPGAARQERASGADLPGPDERASVPDGARGGAPGGAAGSAPGVPGGVPGGAPPGTPGSVPVARQGGGAL